MGAARPANTPFPAFSLRYFANILRHMRQMTRLREIYDLVKTVDPRHNTCRRLGLARCHLMGYLRVEDHLKNDCEILRGTHRKLGLKIWPALLLLKLRTEMGKYQTFFATRAKLNSGPRLLIFPSLGIHLFHTSWYSFPLQELRWAPSADCSPRKVDCPET